MYVYIYIYIYIYIYKLYILQHWALYAKVDSTPTFIHSYIYIYLYIYKFFFGGGGGEKTLSLGSKRASKQM